MKIEKLPFGVRLIVLVRKLQRFNWKFNFNDFKFSYFIHSYNRTYNNERSVEISLAKYFYSKCGTDKSCLELGNVTSHYLKKPKIVIDKYEIASGVTNIDFLDFESDVDYDFISISTIEHIGHDESKRYSHLNDSASAQRKENIQLQVFNKIYDITASDSKVLITIPLGYNRELDNFITNFDLSDLSIGCLARVSSTNCWRQCSLEEGLNQPYSGTYPAANAIAILYRNLF